MTKGKGGCLAVLLLPLIAVVLTFGRLILMVALGTPGNAEANGICATPGVPPMAKPAGSKSVAGFSGEQFKNTGQIMSAAADLDLPVSAQILGVQAAIGECTLDCLPCLIQGGNAKAKRSTLLNQTDSVYLRGYFEPGLSALLVIETVHR